MFSNEWSCCRRRHRHRRRRRRVQNRFIQTPSTTDESLPLPFTNQPNRQECMPSVVAAEFDADRLLQAASSTIRCRRRRRRHRGALSPLFTFSPVAISVAVRVKFSEPSTSISRAHETEQILGAMLQSFAWCLYV